MRSLADADRLLPSLNRLRLMKADAAPWKLDQREVGFLACWRRTWTSHPLHVLYAVDGLFSRRIARSLPYVPERRDLPDASSLASLLRRYMDQRGISQSELARQAHVPKATIHHWLSGDSQRPYHRAGVLSVAAGLGLRRTETNRILIAAGFPTLDRIAMAADPGELKLLSRWSTTVRNNLPADLTSFVGREQEVMELADLLCEESVRLVTLTGTGGSGKTRLALRVAREVIDVFPDGIFFVPLASVSNPKLVMQTIAETIGLRDVQDAALHSRLTGWLRTRCVLLVLDNLEQLSGVGADITELLRDAPQLKVLATSRIPLHVRGEHDWPVDPLPLPSLNDTPPELWKNSAVELFVQRAIAADPKRHLTESDAISIGGICARLDGLPLAIELAAARVRDHDLSQLLTDFPTRLDLGSDGPRDATPRHRTLRQTIAWSVDLLPEPEREFLIRLSVFVGGWSADAAAAACFDEAQSLEKIAHGLSRLVDASLIERMAAPTGAIRYRMLETIREYLLEQRREAPDDVALRDRHASFFLDVVESAAPYVPELRSDDSFERIDADLDNVRVALDWVKTQDNLERLARFTAALWPYWHEYLRVGEGWIWSQYVLPCREQLSLSLRARVVTGASVLASVRFFFDEAEELGREALALWQSLGDHRGPAILYRQLGWGGYMGGASESSIALLTAAVDEWRQVGDTRGIVIALNDLGLAHSVLGNLDKAVPCFDEAEVLGRCLHDELIAARLCRDRGLHALLSGDFDEAIDLLNEAVTAFRPTGRTYLITGATFYLGTAYCFAGKLHEALHWYLEALELPNARDDKGHLSLTLLGFAAVASRQGDAIRAAVLSGASQALQQANQIVFPAAVQAIYDREIEQVRQELGDMTLAEAFARGSQMSTDQMLAFARAGAATRS